MDNFDLMKARIAQSLLPNGYTIVKGEEVKNITDSERVNDNTEETTFTKADVMERMDAVEDQMNEIEELHKEGVANKRHEEEYMSLNRTYTTLHNKYKTM